MGTYTDFTGAIRITPCLKEPLAGRFRQFLGIRHMKRDGKILLALQRARVPRNNAPKASGHDIRFAGLHVPADGGASLCDGSQFDILLVF